MKNPTKIYTRCFIIVFVGAEGRGAHHALHIASSDIIIGPLQCKHLNISTQKYDYKLHIIIFM